MLVTIFVHALWANVQKIALLYASCLFCPRWCNRVDRIIWLHHAYQAAAAFLLIAKIASNPMNEMSASSGVKVDELFYYFLFISLRIIHYIRKYVRMEVQNVSIKLANVCDDCLCVCVFARTFGSRCFADAVSLSHTALIQSFAFVASCRRLVSCRAVRMSGRSDLEKHLLKKLSLHVHVLWFLCKHK